MMIYVSTWGSLPATQHTHLPSAQYYPETPPAPQKNAEEASVLAARDPVNSMKNGMHLQIVNEVYAIMFKNVKIKHVHIL